MASPLVSQCMELFLTHLKEIHGVIRTNKVILQALPAGSRINVRSDKLHTLSQRHKRWCGPIMAGSVASPMYTAQADVLLLFQRRPRRFKSAPGRFKDRRSRFKARVSCFVVEVEISLVAAALI